MLFGNIVLTFYKKKKKEEVYIICVHVEYYCIYLSMFN